MRCHTRIYPLTLIVLFLTMSAWAEKGPLIVKNQFPPHLMLLKPIPDSPGILPQNQFKFSLGIDYSSVFVQERSKKWAALIDMEMTVVDFSIEYGFTEDLMLCLDLPWVSMNNGFLDDFLEDYHNAFDFPNYGREHRPKDEFAYLLRKQGKNWFKAKSGGFQIADSSIAAKFSLVDEKDKALAEPWFFPKALSLSYALKIPIGEEDQGFGSGEFDHRFSLFSKFCKSSFAVYLNPSIVFLSDPETLGADVSFHTIYGIFLGGEYIYSDALSLLAQMNYYSSPFEDTGIEQLDADTLQLELGFKYRLSDSLCLEFAFCEDLTHAAPDFNVHLRLAYPFGK